MKGDSNTKSDEHSRPWHPGVGAGTNANSPCVPRRANATERCHTPENDMEVEFYTHHRCRMFAQYLRQLLRVHKNSFGRGCFVLR